MCDMTNPCSFYQKSQNHFPARYAYSFHLIIKIIYIFFNFNKKNNIEKKNSDIHTNYTQISQSEKKRSEREICRTFLYTHIDRRNNQGKKMRTN